MKRISVIIALMTLLILSSCSEKRVFEEYQEIPDYRWKRQKNIVFTAEIENAEATYNIYIAIRHITQYPFRNLLVTSIMKTPSGEERFLNHDLRVRDEQGNPLGNGMGDLWDINIPIRKNFKFNKSGSVVIEFENRMPRTDTPGIMEIGLIIEKV